jgi:hypothetical protein
VPPAPFGFKSCSSPGTRAAPSRPACITCWATSPWRTIQCPAGRYSPRTPASRRPSSRENYLIASSYGAVYGILSGDGKRLFISDAVNYKEYSFDRTANDVGGSSVNSPKAKYEKMIRAGILAINCFYHYKGGE